MDDFGVFVAGDREVALRFDEFPKKLHDVLLTKITSLAGKLEERVLFFIPRGKTESRRRLASFVKKEVFDDKGVKIVGRVTFSGDYEKAGAVEWGVHSSFSQKLHDESRSTVFGRRISAPIDVVIKRHTRTVNIAPAHMLVRAEGSIAGDAEQELRQAVDQATAEGDQ